jgi:hypothetical protein
VLSYQLRLHLDSMQTGCKLVQFFVTLDRVTGIQDIASGHPGEHTMLSCSTAYAVWFDRYGHALVTPDRFPGRQNIVALRRPESTQCSAIECICS